MEACAAVKAGLQEAKLVEYERHKTALIDLKCINY